MAESDRILDPSYDLFSPVISDNSNIGFEHITIQPDIGPNLEGKNSFNDIYEYFYQGKDFYDLSGAYFVGRARIDGTLTKATNGHLSIINNTINNAFNRAELFLGGSTMAESIENYGLCDTVMKDVFASSEWISSVGKDSFYYSETNSGRQEAVTGSLATFTGGYYTGAKNSDIFDAQISPSARALRKRFITGCNADGDIVDVATCTPKTDVWFTFKPSFGLFSGAQHKTFKDVSFRIRLYRQDHPFMFCNTGTSGGETAADLAHAQTTTWNADAMRFVIKEMSLKLPIRHPDLSIKLAIEEKLANSMVAYNYKTVKSNYVNMTPQNGTFSGTLANWASTPEMVFVVMQNTNRERYTGGHFSGFDHFDTKNMYITVNGSKRYPFESLTTQFGTTSTAGIENYSEALALIRRCNYGMNDYLRGQFLTTDNFNAFPIFAFLTTPSGDEKLPMLNREPCRIDVHVTCDNSLYSAKMYIIGVFNSVIEVNGTSNISKVIY